MTEGGEPVVGPWPGLPKFFQGNAATYAPQDESDDDGIIGVPEDGNEVGDHVERYGQVGEQQCDPDANTGREVWIGGQSSQRAEQVRKEAQRLFRRSPFGRRMTKAITSAGQDSSKAAAKPTITSNQIRPPSRSVLNGCQTNMAVVAAVCLAVAELGSQGGGLESC